jgi:peptidoglycan/xylan/chitin deacetylase (PgdA/CDA1 family)
MRVDRTISMIVASHQRSGAAAADGKIPILMYHSISTEQSGGARSARSAYRYFETSTSPAVFRRHMETLHVLGYTVIRLKDLGQAFSQSLSKGRKYSVITFDDGYADFYDTAFPILQAFKFPATMFVPTAFIGAPGPGIEGKTHLTWPQVREAHSAGIDIGSHTVNHLKLADLSVEQILHQLRESKKTIEDNLGTAVDTFAYPFAFPEGRRGLVTVLRGLLVESGYRAGVCTSIGRVSPEDDRLFLRRLPVNTFDDEAFFRAKLAGAYDWLHGSQVFVKRLKNLVQFQHGGPAHDKVMA